MLQRLWYHMKVLCQNTGWHVNELKGWYFAIQTKREGVNFIDKAKGNIEILLY